jgi:hypothetical protein
MECHPHAERLRMSNAFIQERPLSGVSGRQRIRSTLKDRESTVTFAARSNHLATMLGNERFDQYVMPR